ncbi:hypothetical protein RHDE110596_23210 [Prescottella defluvii]|nr:hypothetical protein [Prescottella defluvii]
MATPDDRKHVPVEGDVQSDPSGRDTWAEEGGATPPRTTTDDADSSDGQD